MRVAVVAGVVLFTLPCLANDVSLDLVGSRTAASADNPRSGNAGVLLSGSLDFNDAWSGWMGLGYTRDFATRTAQSASAGSNVVLVTAGATFMPSEHFAVTLMGALSPRATQLNATTVTVARRTADVLIRSVTASQGVTLVGSYSTSGLSDFESNVDVSAGFTHFNTFQVLELPDTLGANALRTACVSSPNSLCPLVNGATTALTQVRLGATYAAQLGRALTVGLDAAYFLYDADPSQVGFFTLVVAGRVGPELGSGVPVAPYLFTVKPFVSYRFKAATVRLSYQFGLSTASPETLRSSTHVGSLRATFKLSTAWRLTAGLTVQADATQLGLANLGGTTSLGVMWTD